MIVNTLRVAITGRDAIRHWHQKFKAGRLDPRLPSIVRADGSRIWHNKKGQISRWLPLENLGDTETPHVPWWVQSRWMPGQ